MDDRRKATGSYYTPEEVAHSLVRWAVQHPTDRLLDPSCGDGRFLCHHRPAVGVEQDRAAATTARQRAPGAVVHEREFFTWARQTRERFECAAGNPPFIRYQRFSGETRAAALKLCKTLGASFSSLTSSWAPFLVATANLLKPGGRMAFIVPAEIGHAPYAIPLLKYLVDHFSTVQVVAVREKIFADLSEDCWLLFADGYGLATDFIGFTALERFTFTPAPPKQGQRIGMVEWSYWNYRLRPFVLSSNVRSLYRSMADASGSHRLGDVAKVGIGYVTGDNDFFHLTPSEAETFGIPESCLQPTVRNGRVLGKSAVTAEDVRRWLEQDEAVLLLRLRPHHDLASGVRRYLRTPAAEKAKVGFKCRTRNPWYVVPDVTIPHAFLSYMSGTGPSLVANRARCACTNSIHAVALTDKLGIGNLQRRWASPFTELSCELEGHPLGGGMLKLEPGEASRIVLAAPERRSQKDELLVRDGIATMRQWRHYG